MRLILWSIPPALALAACGGEAPAPTPAESTTSTPAPAEAEVGGQERRILAFGDSLFAGYGLAEDEGYPEKLQVALRAQGINAAVTDAGVSGDTTAAGRQRIGFVLDALGAKPDLVLVELGGNDLLRGLSPAAAKANLAAILEELRTRQIPAVLFGMRAPPNAGPEYQAEFDAIYPALAAEYGVPLVPFFLEAVYDKPDLMQGDRVHPTSAGIDALVAATLKDVAAALPEED